jgi:hypothetical protein
VNRDGRADILLGATYQTQSRLYLGQRDGRFAEVGATHLPALPASVGDLELGDVDGDFDLDLLVACRVCDGSLIFANDGRGHLKLAARTPADTRGTLGIAVADLDGDARPDVVEAQGEKAFDERIPLGRTLPPDTAAPAIERASVLGETGRERELSIGARVHDRKSPSLPEDLGSVVLHVRARGVASRFRCAGSAKTCGAPRSSSRPPPASSTGSARWTPPATARARLRSPSLECPRERVDEAPVTSPQNLLREYAALDRARREAGVTPLEYQRWLALAQQLDRLFPGRPIWKNPGSVRLRVEFADRGRLRDCVMREMRPVGVFVFTPFAADIGTRFELSVVVEETGESGSGAVRVASTHVGPGFSTNALGMGLRLREPESPLRALLDSLFA